MTDSVGANNAPSSAPEEEIPISEEVWLWGQYTPGTSLIHRLDVRLKFLYFIALLASVILASGGWALLLWSAVTVLLIFAAGLPWLRFIKSFRLGFWLFIAVFLTELFFTSGLRLVSWLPITREGLMQGIVTGGKLLLFIALSQIFTLSTSPREIFALTRWLLSPLKFFRVPVDDLAWLMTAALKLLPLIQKETRRLAVERRKQLQPPGFIAKLEHASDFLTDLILRVYEKAEKELFGGGQMQIVKPGDKIWVWHPAESWGLILFIVLAAFFCWFNFSA